MKTNEVNRPRLVCRAVRTWKSFSNPEAAPTAAGLGSSHLQHCADCQAYFQGENELTHLLHSDALIQRSFGSPGLEQRIVHAARRSVRAEHTVAPRFNLMPVAGVLASVVLLAVILAPQIAVMPPSGRGVPVPAFKAITMQEAEQNLRNYLAPPAELLKQNPLQNEVDLVYSDARSAWRFLKLNFLPTSNVPVSAGRQDV